MRVGPGSGEGLEQALQVLACPWPLSGIAHQRCEHIVPLVGAGVTWSSGMTFGACSGHLLAGLGSSGLPFLSLVGFY